MPGLCSIIAIEGPLCAEEALKIFNRAAGGKRLRGAKPPLLAALKIAKAKGEIQTRLEAEPGETLREVVWATGMPDVLIRRRGHRRFSDVPMSEISALLKDLRPMNPSLGTEELYRAALDFYETKKMTKGIRAKLELADVLDSPEDTLF